MYLLQGISGKYIQFSLLNDKDSKIVFMDGMVCRTDCRVTEQLLIRFQNPISAPTRTLIHHLSELGYLYSRVESFIREREAARGVGMIEQSLCHHLQAQLTEYYRLIAVLETQMIGTQNFDDLNQTNFDSETGLSLRRLDVWVNEWRLRMRMMSVCVEGARGQERVISLAISDFLSQKPKEVLLLI